MDPGLSITSPSKACSDMSPAVSGKCKKSWQFASDSWGRKISGITPRPVLRDWTKIGTFKLGLLRLVFQEPKMGGLKLIITKEARILICQARSNGSTIKELCSSFGLTRRMVVRILQRNLILPVDKHNYQQIVLDAPIETSSAPFYTWRRF